MFNKPFSLSLLLLSILDATTRTTATKFSGQEPLGWETSSYSYAKFEPDLDQYYTFPWPIRKVAIIGAGVSGLVAYREFTAAGFVVRLFERDSVPGGNWHYTEQTPLDAPIPNVDVCVGDFVPSLPPGDIQLPYEERYEGSEVTEELLRRHRGPKPIWKSLVTNLPPPLQQFPAHPWPPGQPWPLPHEKIAKYIRAFASFNGINSNDVENPRIAYNTRVELVEKRFISTEDGPVRSGWTLTLKQVTRTGRNSSKAVWTKEDFDAVVVATGRFNAPNVPNIQGLKEWADRFPDRIRHSRQYRHPEPYENKTVLIVGAAASAVEIAADVVHHAGRVYQSIRHPNAVGNLIFLGRLPGNVTKVPEIKRFLPPMSSIATSQVEFTNGTILTGIESVIFATGYRYSFPFLPQFHNTSGTARKTESRPIVTDGTHLRDLYLDFLSIEEPTLGFMSMNQEIAIYTYSEYLALALSKVWGNQAKIPSTARMWEWNEEHVEKKGGYGKGFQFLGIFGLHEMVRTLTGWLNQAAVKYGGRQINGVDPDELGIYVIWFQARFGVDILSLRGDTNLTSMDPLSSPLTAMPFGSYGVEASVAKRIDDLLRGHDW